jgi:peptidoglycan/LPS O-acetylase OafA/YrhL
MQRANRSRPLDGLRGVAITLVVLYHARAPGPLFRRIVGGWCGVDLFFVLSGFLITRNLLNERDRDGAISLRTFYKRRWRRLGPYVPQVAEGLPRNF